MEQQNWAVYLSLILLLGFLIPVIRFFITQQQLLKMIQPEHRSMQPGQIWLQLIPVFGLVWQFIVIRRLSESIYNQLTTPAEGMLFGEVPNVPTQPTYRQGLTYAILFCVSVIPLPIVTSVLTVVGIGAWIMYWIELAKYKRLIKERVLVY